MFWKTTILSNRQSFKLGNFESKSLKKKFEITLQQNMIDQESSQH